MNKIGFRLNSFSKIFSELPGNIPANYYRFYIVVSYTSSAALLSHFLNIFIFFLISVRPLALLNIGSTLIWISVLWFHSKGRMNIVLSLAIFEINIHAVLCVFFIGWGAGFQYFILIMPLIFITPFLGIGTKFVITLLSYILYTGLHFLFANSLPLHTLEPWINNIMYYGNILLLFFIFSLISFYYNTAAMTAERALEKEKVKSDEMTILLKKMFGRYLSPEVMTSLIENPSALELGGERRSVTIMMTDLRGFTAFSERFEPEKVVQTLNGYFEVMVEVVLKYNGTINEIIGDALLVIFGAPQEMPDRAQRAIACSIEMQNAMNKVNKENRKQDLPDLEMGIGLNEAEVIVGNIGSSKRSKYTVVGSGVNIASRIESYTVGGQILISESVRQKAGEVLRIDAQRDVFPKGADTYLRIYEVGGIAGPYNIAKEGKDLPFATLTQEIPLRYSILEGKDVGEMGYECFISKLSNNGAEIIFNEPVDILANLKMNLADVGEKLSAKDFYGKAIQQLEEEGKKYVVRFTSVPPEVDAYLQALLLHTVKPVTT